MTIKIPDTERLRFEFVTEKDSEFMFQLDQDPEVMRYVTGGKITTREFLRDVVLPRMARYANQESGWGIWRVIAKQDNQDLGWILVRPNNFFSDAPEFDNLELGWRFHRHTWGKGIATEAAKAVAAEVTKSDQIKRISAIADFDNHGSVRIMQKLGMKFIKRYTHRDNQLGEFDVVYYEKILGES